MDGLGDDISLIHHALELIDDANDDRKIKQALHKVANLFFETTSLVCYNCSRRQRVHFTDSNC